MTRSPKEINWTSQYVTIRKDQREKLKLLAKKNYRTIDGQIRFILDEFLDMAKEEEK